MTGSDEHAYFLAIEDTFIRLRGAPLLLSPADWQVASAWHEEGIPLEMVLDTLEQIFARRAEREERGDIQSLRYCRRAVERAWKDLREVTATGVRRVPPELDQAKILNELAAAVPGTLPGAESLVARILEVEGDSQTLESRLADLDLEMIAAAESTLDQEAAADIERAVDEAIAGLAVRLGPAEAAEARERLRRQILRRRAGLPILSLFAGATHQD